VPSSEGYGNLRNIEAPLEEPAFILPPLCVNQRMLPAKGKTRTSCVDGRCPDFRIKVAVLCPESIDGEKQHILSVKSSSPQIVTAPGNFLSPLGVDAAAAEVVNSRPVPFH